MKTLLKFSGILIALALTGCSTTYYAASDHDDVYYSPQVVRGGSAQQPVQNEARSEGRVVEVVEDYRAEPAGQSHTVGTSADAYHYDGYAQNQQEEASDTLEYYYDEEGNMVIVNNYYYGDYYDFAYASRIRRFHRPYNNFRYYDPFFTNMYFYMYDPFYYGMSIYYSGFYLGSPMYFGGYYPSPFYWRYRHYPHYHRYAWFGFPYDPYGIGFWHGYNTGFYNSYYRYGGYWGYRDYFYNSFERTADYYYGPRGSGGSTTAGGFEGRTQRTGEKSFAEAFEARTVRNEDGRRQVLADNQIIETGDNARTATRSAEQTDGRQVAEIGQATSRERTGRESGATNHIEDRVRESVRNTTGEPDRATTASGEREASEGYRPARTIESYQAASRERYSRPQQVTHERQSEDDRSNYTPPRSYTSPSYQQPSTPQRSRPATTPGRTEGSRQVGAQPATPPARSTTTQPTRVERGRPSYTPPSRPATGSQGSSSVRTPANTRSTGNTRVGGSSSSSGRSTGTSVRTGSSSSSRSTGTSVRTGSSSSSSGRSSGGTSSGSSSGTTRTSGGGRSR